jgi:hypothetical protein
MKNKRIIIAALCLLAFVVAKAQDKHAPDLQIADNSFFDPTKKKVEETKYQFGVEYRLEAGYAQHEQRTRSLSYPQLFLHGARVGATFDFLLPLHFSLQTGLLYTITCGRHEQHWRSMSSQAVKEEIIKHTVTEHNLTVPLRVYYVIPLWQKLNLFFYTGPQLHIGLAEKDKLKADLTDETRAWLAGQGIPTDNYDRMEQDRTRANIQWGLGGGLEWDCFRLQSGYDFGLNNLARKQQYAPNRYMSEWGWFVTFCYRIN